MNKETFLNYAAKIVWYFGAALFTILYLKKIASFPELSDAVSFMIAAAVSALILIAHTIIKINTTEDNFTYDDLDELRSVIEDVKVVDPPMARALEEAMPE